MVTINWVHLYIELYKSFKGFENEMGEILRFHGEPIDQQLHKTFSSRKRQIRKMEILTIYKIFTIFI